MNLVALDFETHYSSKAGYTLKKLTTEEYIRSNDFEAIMVSIAPFDGKRFVPTNYIGSDIKRGLASIDWEDTMMLAWNAHFDAAIVSWRYGYRIKAPICSMSCFRMMGLPVLAGGESLSAATKWARENGYADRIVTKGEEVILADGKRLADFTPTQLAAYSRYCDEDTVNAGEFFRICMERGLPPSELPAMAEIIRCFTEPSLRLDTAVMQSVNAEQVAAQKAALDKAGIMDVTQLRSDAKFAQVLISMGVKPGMKKNKKGQMKFAFAKSDDFMDELLNGEDETLAALAEARVANKTTIVQSRTQRLVDISKRGPLPVMLKPAGAHTTRLAGGDNVNCQNWSKRGNMRSGLIAEGDYWFIAADKAQIELRINGYVSGDDTLMDLFRAGADLYSDYGNKSGMFPGLTISKATENERFMCKGVVLGGGFGSGAAALEAQIIKLARDLKLDIDLSQFDFERAKDQFRAQRKAIVNNWYSTGRQLDAFIAGQDTQRGADGLVHYVAGKGFRLPNGTFIWYHDLRWETEEVIDPDTGEITEETSMWFTGSKYGKRVRKYIYPAKAVENYVQGLSALNIREDWAEIVRRARREIGIKWGSIKLQIHDALVAKVHKDAVTDYAALMTEVMTTPPWWAPNLPLAVEVKIGKNYKEV